MPVESTSDKRYIQGNHFKTCFCSASASNRKVQVETTFRKSDMRTKKYAGQNDRRTQNAIVASKRSEPSDPERFLAPISAAKFEPFQVRV